MDEYDRNYDEAARAAHPALSKALCEALLQENMAEIKLLLEHYGADPNAVIYRCGESGYYLSVNDHSVSLPTKPFVVAMLQGNNEIIRLLLEKGANPNCQYDFRWREHFSVTITPLGQAIKEGDIALVKLLLEKGASTSCVWRSGDSYNSSVSAQSLAGREGMQEIGDFLEEQEKAREEWERTRPKTQQEINDSLYHAVRYGDLRAAEEALSKGADAGYEYDDSDDSEHDYRTMPVLYMACASKNAEMVRLLLSHGANPNARFFHFSGVSEYSESKPCLTAAISSSSVEIVRLLLEAGANPTAESGYKERDWMYGSVLSQAEQRGESDPAFLEIANLLKEYASGKSQAGTEWALIPKENSGGEDKENSESESMTSSKEPEGATEQPKKEDALPARLEFNIEFNSRTGTDAGWKDAYHEHGVVTFGGEKLEFHQYCPAGPDTGPYYPDLQWIEGAKRLLSGHDRTAFILYYCLGNEGNERLPVWREGDRVYSTVVAEEIPGEFYNKLDNLYEGVESLSAIRAYGTAPLRVISLQAIRDYLSSIAQFYETNAGPSKLQATRDFLSSLELMREQLEALERPCARCGQEIRRCNRCEECFNCRGGVGSEEYGLCVKCAKRLPFPGRAEIDRMLEEA